MSRWLNRLANFFPLWVVLCSGLALERPGLFTWFSGDLIVVGLALIMVGMGLTLTVDDVQRVARMPGTALAGLVAQFAIMPCLGWTLARGLHLDPELAVGLVLVACCPGGTASNVVSYIARADVALSVLMTMCSTFASVVMTPLLTKFLAGTYVAVDAAALFRSTLQVVVLPVIAGLLLNRLFPRLVRTINPVAPLVSVMFIALICASIIGSTAQLLKTSGATLFLAVGLLHAGGFMLGYVFARVFGYPEVASRTIAIEVGMQNSGLGAVLARSNFPALALAPLPSALSASFHSIIGSLLAAWWRYRPPAAPHPDDRRAAPLAADARAPSSD